jgi:hypothetical protein
MPRKSIGETAMTDAERQARYRAARAAGKPVNRKHHSEIDDTPLARFLAGPAVTRPCPDAGALRLAFTRTERRTPRKSDGTAVIEGRRFEVPNRYRHLSLLEVRFPNPDDT